MNFDTYSGTWGIMYWPAC